VGAPTAGDEARWVVAEAERQEAMEWIGEFPDVLVLEEFGVTFHRT